MYIKIIVDVNNHLYFITFKGNNKRKLQYILQNTGNNSEEIFLTIDYQLESANENVALTDE